MPATAREFGVRNPFNPEESIRGGVAYLKHRARRRRQTRSGDPTLPRNQRL